MNFEIIEKEAIVSKPDLTCFVCKKTNKGNYHYAMMKNTYYCTDCMNDLPFVDSIIDKKFRELYKIINELSNGLVEKNERLKTHEEKIINQQDKIDKLCAFVETIEYHLKEVDEESNIV